MRLELLEERTLLSVGSFDGEASLQGGLGGAMAAPIIETCADGTPLAVTGTTPELSGTLPAFSTFDVTFNQPIDPATFGSRDLGLLELGGSNVSLLGALGGTFHDCDTDGSLLYAATGAGLQILDVSDPAGVTRLGGYATSGISFAVEVVGSVAYVADDSAGLQILDVSDPAAVARLGGYDTPGDAWDVQVVGNLAYVADESAGFQILDVSDPAAVTLLGGYNTSGYARGVQVVGDLAYVADSHAGLQVLDVSDPAAVSLLGGYDTPGNARDVQVVGGLVYVADSSSGLQILDVSDPAAVTLLGGYDTPSYARDAQVVGNLAYVADYASGLQILDVSNPAAVTRLGGYDTPGNAVGLQVVGDVAYLADNAAGLQILDVSNPAAVARPGGYEAVIGYAMDVQVVDNVAYVADDHAGLRILDVSNPAAMTLLGGYNTSGYARKVQVVGNLAYVADYSSGLQILDVSDPAAVARLGGYDTLGTAWDVRVVGNVAYVADGSAGLQILDVSNPAAVTRLDWHDTQWARGVEVVGNLAYVADESAGLKIFDVSDPAAVALLGEYNTSGYARDVQVAGNLAYVADYSAGLQILDVSDPAAVTRLGGYDTPGGADALQVIGDLAFVADVGAGLQILDVSDPAAVTRTGGYDMSGYAYAIQVVGNVAYVADGGGGVHTLEFGWPASSISHLAGDTYRVDLGRTVLDGSYALLMGPEILDADGDAMDQDQDGTPGEQSEDFFLARFAVNTIVPFTVLTFPADGASYNETGWTDGITGIAWGSAGETVSKVEVSVQQGAGNYWDGDGFDSATEVLLVATGTESWSLAFPGGNFPADGQYTVRAFATDTAVKIGPAATATFTYDTVAPIVTVNPLTTDDMTPAITGTFNDGTLQVVLNGKTYTVGDGNLTESGTDWTLQIPAADALSYGTYDVAASAVDAAGNIGADGTVNELTVDPSLAVFDVSPELTGTLPPRSAIDVTFNKPIDPATFDTRDVGLLDLANLDVSLVEQFGGRFLDCATDGSLLYALTGADMKIFDVSDPANVTQVGAYDLFGFSLEVVGNLAYVASGSSGLKILDVSNPAAVTFLGWYNTPGLAEDVQVVGDLAYVADYASGLHVLDVADPAAITRLGGYSLTYAHRSHVVGDVAYVVDYSTGLHALDVSNPASVTRLGGYDTPGLAADVQVVGSLAYMANSREGLHILDVSDPAAVTRLGGYDTSGEAKEVQVVGNLAYVADYSTGLQILDVADPAAVAFLGGYDTRGLASRLQVLGNLAYVNDDAAGFQILDVADPAAVTRLGGYDWGDIGWDVELVGNLAYVAEGDAGLQILDISDLAAPVRLGGYDTPGSARDVLLMGNLAYVADDTAGLHILDVSNPAAVTRLGGFDWGYAEGLHVEGNLAYLSGRSGGFRIVDVSDPSAVTLLDSYNLFFGYDLDVVGNLAYVADGADGIQILDVSNPTAITHVARYDTWGFNADVVQVVDGLAYVGASDDFHILDVSDPSAVTYLGGSGNSVRDVQVVGNLAYLACSRTGLQILDVSQPGSVSHLGSYYTTGANATRVHVSGNLAYVADGVGGVSIIEVGSPAATISHVAGNTYRLELGQTLAGGDYALLLGPEILDTGGAAMDQDQDGTTREVSEDIYFARFGVDFLEYGDAPAPYPTLLASNGARHTATGPTLGANRDAESDGQPTLAADGDDTTGTPDDEDGLVDPAGDLDLLVGETPTVDVKVTNNTGAEATLYGWIDYNGDGLFDNATERASTAVADGSTNATVTLTFPVVPAGFVGDTYARFRLSTDAAAAEPTGAASDGEVEDYTVSGRASVVDGHRYIFYDNSYWDGNTAGPNTTGGPGGNGDDGAIATDKSALLPGGTATSANFTSYDKGINGIMVDVAGLANPTAVGDGVFTEFDFRVGNDSNPSGAGWTTAAAPTDVDVRNLGGGLHRVSFFWTAGAIPTRNWLQLTLKAGATTGLAQDDVFYFGNAIGDANLDCKTLYDDIFAIYTGVDFVNFKPITEPCDVTRDGKVLYDDIFACYSEVDFTSSLALITPPVTPSAPAPGFVARPSGEIYWAAQLAALDELNRSSDDAEEEDHETAADAVLAAYGGD